MTVHPSPALVGIAHGTSSSDGRTAVAGLMRAVAAARPELTVALGFVDVQHPDTPETLAALEPRLPAVVVPLLLSAGYHVHVDLTDAVAAETERPVVLGPALGPDDRLIALLRHRLDESGLAADDVVVLAVAGSSDIRAVADCRVVAEGLAAASGRPIALGFLSAARPPLACTVTRTRIENPGRRIVVSSYLLAPGYFQGLVEKAGADVTTRPLLVPDEPASQFLVDVVISRYLSAV
ncbi:cobalamin biosynthesis protein CbiX [Cryobacterium roopkundense]|uniref:Cobalamin biosynthesis protein CbiX n=1 Tax=Cryobacterium roopkundense TaxID=1001240 RepID=A0A099JNY5_9MICO|nr:CbiX/SirB N-terminal domain-containing protein [Cryobacterium roopkundense]KGJ80089.1 cobalamin biosynthesis protein CbiX [Cryobacterium roopkundense]MBB5641619.1 sirohydrochlorin ferrochelatase [Cryobacterium roopkundense]